MRETITDFDTRRAMSVLGTALLVALVLPFVIYAVPQVVGASHSYVVLSDSMSPAIGAGDVVIVDSVSPSEISEDDVITFRNGGGDRATGDTDKVTHRVVEVVEQDGERYFRTKGDANEEVDAELVPAGNVVGRVSFHIPYIGHVLTFGSARSRLLALVVVPSVLLIVNEVWTLYAEAKASKSTRGDSDAAEAAVPDGESAGEPNGPTDERASTDTE